MHDLYPFYTPFALRQVKMENAYGGEDAVLTFPIDKIIELRYNSPVHLQYEDGGKERGLFSEMEGVTPTEVVLGFVTWMFYYTVIDYGHSENSGKDQSNTKITFVAKE